MFGVSFEIILAIVIYMVATVFATEIIKKLLAKIKLVINSLILSWIVGIGCYILISTSGWYEFNFKSVIMFMLITGLLNSVYKFTKLKDLIKRIVEKKF